MSQKHTEAMYSSQLSISSTRFIDNFVKNMAVHKFCMNLASTTRVTRNIIDRLSKTGIDE